MMNPHLKFFLNCKQWAKRHPQLTIALLISFAGLTLRLIPYSVPIQANHLIQDDQAIDFRDRNGLPLPT
jgi:penicillin-binding protein 1C